MKLAGKFGGMDHDKVEVSIIFFNVFLFHF